MFPSGGPLDCINHYSSCRDQNGLLQTPWLSEGTLCAGFQRLLFILVGGGGAGSRDEANALTPALSLLSPPPPLFHLVPMLEGGATHTLSKSFPLS